MSSMPSSSDSIMPSSSDSIYFPGITEGRPVPISGYSHDDYVFVVCKCDVPMWGLDGPMGIPVKRSEDGRVGYHHFKCLDCLTEGWIYG